MCNKEYLSIISIDLIYITITTNTKTRSCNIEKLPFKLIAGAGVEPTAHDRRTLVTMTAIVQDTLLLFAYGKLILWDHMKLWDMVDPAGFLREILNFKGRV